MSIEDGHDGFPGLPQLDPIDDQESILVISNLYRMVQQEPMKRGVGCPTLL
ncbi:unnamed protein product [Lupinus luteus]|uniref:Uncharacterized protein n=1 Tax=Lupinus luteus TaxID=3873 RepID=A0AAV1XJB5_LUPLU